MLGISDNLAKAGETRRVAGCVVSQQRDQRPLQGTEVVVCFDSSRSFSYSDKTFPDGLASLPQELRWEHLTAEATSALWLSLRSDMKERLFAALIFCLWEEETKKHSGMGFVGGSVVKVQV